MTVNQVEWINQQVENYKDQYKARYEKYAVILKEVLGKLVFPFVPKAVISTREKSIASFTEKLTRKEYRDPLSEITDLCGARIIVITPGQVNTVRGLIESEKYFTVDRENSVDTSKRLGTKEFYYKSYHYIVQLKPEGIKKLDAGINIPEELADLKAEIQVRTFLEHAWAEYEHEVIYKRSYPVPDRWRHEFARLAAVLEEADRSFLEIEEGLHKRFSSYQMHLEDNAVGEIQEEIEKLRIVYRYDIGNQEIAYRIGKLEMMLGNWGKAVEIFSGNPRFKDYQPLLKELGIASCKLHIAGTDEYKRGQDLIEQAIKLNEKDADAIASLAGTWKGVVEEKARENYQKAFKISPGDPYILGNYLEYEIEAKKDIAIVTYLAPLMEAAIERCRDEIGMGINLPWAYYNLGKFYLMTGKEDESLKVYIKAAAFSTHEWMIETSVKSLERLCVFDEFKEACCWIKMMLAAVWFNKFSSAKARAILEAYKQDGHEWLKAPIVILEAGQAACEGQKACTPLLEEALKDLGNRTMYSLDFESKEVIRTWVDIIDSGIQASEVKVLGSNTGKITAVGYQMALLFGAKAAVVGEKVGRTVRIDENDKNYKGAVAVLPAESASVKAFIEYGSRGDYDEETRSKIGQDIHEAYREEQAKSNMLSDPSMKKWEKLREDLKESNMQQGDNIMRKLSAIGCSVHKVSGHKVSIMTFTDDEIEIMAEMEHARWNIERLMQGWTYGEKKNAEKKISPYIVPWEVLSEDIREWDRQTVRKIPGYLAKVDMEIRRKA